MSQTKTATQGKPNTPAPAPTATPHNPATPHPVATAATPATPPVATPHPDGNGQVNTPAVDAKAEGDGETKKKTKTGVPRPRLPKFNEDHVITVLKPNAKTRMSGDRFNQYVNGMTVKQYIEKMQGEPWKRTIGQIYGDLRWDTDPNRNLINIGPTVVDIPPPPPPKEKKVKAKKEAAPAAAEANTAAPAAAPEAPKPAA